MSAKESGNQSQDREWMITNPRGGFAYGTQDRLPRRRYHGLLSARAPYFELPHQILAEVNEVIQNGAEGFELAAFDYEVGIHPRGFSHLARFESSADAVCWEYRLGRSRLKRTLRLVPGKLAVQLDYEGEGFEDGSAIKLFPYFSCRSIHELQEENAILDGRIAHDGEKLLLKFYKYFPELVLWAKECASAEASRSRFEANGFWNAKVSYSEEKRRGYWHKEDLFCPGSFQLPLAGSFRHCLIIGVSDDFDEVVALPPWSPRPELAGMPGLAGLPVKGRARRKGAGGEAKAMEATAEDRLRARLETSLLSLLYSPSEGFTTLLAGFPWFEAQTRDQLVAIRGLLACADGPRLAAQLLDTLQERIDEGLLPAMLVLESLGAEGGHELDASLLFVRAVRLYEEKLGKDSVHAWEDSVFEILTAILEHRVKGIHVRPSGLLYASSKPRPRTWMNAMVAGLAVSPRSPFAVELNCLFHEAVCYALELARRLGRKAFLEVWEPIGERLAETFQEAFWLEDDGFLADAHDGVLPVAELRPNQLWAMASPYPLVSREQGARLLALVREHLLTPKGLRSLEPGSKGYEPGPYASAEAREKAWHQGMVWPWLLGIYLDAVAYVEGTEAARAEARRRLSELAPELERGLLGHIPECYGAEAPHQPIGAPSRLWNLSELLYLSTF